MAGLYWEELENSPKLKFSMDKGSATRMFYLPDWGQVGAFLNLFMGVVTNPATGMDEVIRAQFPGYPSLVVNDMNVEPMVGDAIVYGSVPNFYYRGAKVTVEYGTDVVRSFGAFSPGGIPSKQNFSHTTKYGVDVITYPGSTLVWESDGKVAGPDIHGGILSPSIEHDITWRFVTKPPLTAIRAVLGCVNHDLFMGAPQGTLLFLGADLEEEWICGRVFGYKLKYKISEKNNGTDIAPRGWNFFLRPAEPGRAAGSGVETDFYRLAIKGSGNPIYPPINFGVLFNQAAVQDPAFFQQVA